MKDNFIKNTLKYYLVFLLSCSFNDTLCLGHHLNLKVNRFGIGGFWRKKSVDIMPFNTIFVKEEAYHTSLRKWHGYSDIARLRFNYNESSPPSQRKSRDGSGCIWKTKLTSTLYFNSLNRQFWALDFHFQEIVQFSGHFLA